MRLYRWLLGLLPRRLRDQQGDEILAAAEETWHVTRGPWRRTRVLVSLTIDLLWQTATWQVDEVRRRVFGDLRHAMRRLARSPGFTAAAVVTLAVGIGASTTVFSLVNAVYFRPSGFADPDKLVEISETSATALCAGCGVGTSYPGLLDWRARLTSFAPLEAYDEAYFALSAPLVPQRVYGARVSAGLFDTLGIVPVTGRRLRAADDQANAPPVVLLGYGLWQREFGGSTSVVGQTVRVDGVPAEIVGVMPPRFGFPTRSDIWVPFASAPPSLDRTDRRYGVVTRLKRGVPIDRARVEVEAIASALAREYPREQGEWSAEVTLVGADRGGDDGHVFLVMLGAVGCVLAIACANLAALFLARASARRRELSVSAAIGAGRGRLVRQLLMEPLILGVAGGLFGLVLAGWTLRLADISRVGEVPYDVYFSVDWRVLLFCAAISLLTSIVAGIGPAFSATRLDLVAALKQGGSAVSGTTIGRARLRRGFIVVEVALVLVLLSAAAVMGRTFWRFVTAPAGYDRNGLVLAELPLAGTRFQDQSSQRRFQRELTRRIDAMPDVDAGLESTHFIAGFGTTAREISIDGVASIAAAGRPHFAFPVTPRYFAAKGLSIVAGRGVDARDLAGSEPVAIVNRQMASAIWPGQSPLGARLKLPGEPGAPWRTIVGVVTNEDGEPQPGEQAGAYVYVPLDQLPGRPLRLFVRSRLDAATTMPKIAAAVRDIDPDEPLTDVRSASEEHSRRYWFVGYFATFYAAFGAIALLLAVVGVYGVVAQAVGERTREFGIRSALGANRTELYRLVLRGTLAMAMIGIVVGLVGARLTTRFLGFLLFGSSPNDPIVLAVVSALLTLAMIAAGLTPARRAARVDPTIVLRVE